MGPRIAAYFKDAGGDIAVWKMPFLIAGVACLVAAALGLMLKAPKRRLATETQSVPVRAPRELTPSRDRSDAGRALEPQHR